jgi:hypothetical protein
MFLVCAELSKRNLIAMPASSNAKGYDVVVLDPETNAAPGLRVKCNDRKEFPVLATNWRDYEDKITEKIVADFVFVDILDLDKPNYLIVADTEVKDLVKSSIKKYASDCEGRHGLTWELMLDKEMTEKRKPNLWVVSLKQVEAYKNIWDTMINRLRTARRYHAY